MWPTYLERPNIAMGPDDELFKILLTSREMFLIEFWQLF